MSEVDHVKLAVMQPYFFPYVGYFQLIQAVDKFVVYDDVNYIIRGWVNRNRILVNGQDMMISLPLKAASQNKKINEIEVLPDSRWLNKIERTLTMAYSKAPYFPEVKDLVMSILESRTSNLGSFLAKQLVDVVDYLGMSTMIVESSSVYDNAELERQERLIDICRQVQASHYVNSIGGMDLYSKEDFESNDVKLSFLKPRLLEYPQRAKEFVSGLSIIDLMMNNSVEEVSNLLDGYELI